jgi:diguanylate cyclase (GGDEF)-like protein
VLFMLRRDPVVFRQSLLELLEAQPPREHEFLERFEALRREGHPVYSEVLSILTHLSFSEAEARKHWKKVAQHREELRGRLGRDVGLRVAILDYFVNFDLALKNPKVIELSLYQRTERSAVSDGLTGLYNQGYFRSALRREVQRSRRQRFQLSVVLLDLDDFKRVNDTRGHLEGDRVLARTSALVKQTLREIDVAARYGGEEFALILPDTPRQGALVVAERIRKLVERSFRRSRRAPLVTLSGGIATFPDDAGTPEELIETADKGLYRSKAEGKNRVTLAGAERRRHARIPFSHRVTMQGGKAGRIAARSKNVSESGLLLSLRQPVAVGASVELLVHPRSGETLGLQGEVVRVQAPARGHAFYDVGLRLFGDPTQRLLLARAGNA